jgi:hypothetical protein
MAAKMLQELDLSQGALCEDLLAEDIGDFLDRDAFSGLTVGGSTVRFSYLPGPTEGNTYQTIPYAPCPSSLVTVYRSSTAKSWLNTLNTLRPARSPILPV